MLKHILSTTVLVSSLMACAPPRAVSPNIIYHNADFITMDEAGPTANAMSVQGTIISMLGNLEEVQKAYPKAQKIDLGGGAVLPGFIDSHVHVRELGMDRLKADLVGVKSNDEIVTRMSAHYPNPTPGEWLIGQGWDEGYFASIGYPDRAKLDATFPNNPVALESLHGFGGFYNGAALAAAGVDKNTPEATRGKILRRSNGEPTGVMLSVAQDLVDNHVPPRSDAQVEAAIVAGLGEMAKAGVTSIHEAGMTAQDVRAYEALAARGGLPIRVYGLLTGNDKKLMSDWFAKGITDDPDDWLDIRSIKVYYDGSLGSRTAMMRAPYSDKPEAASPSERMDPEDIRRLGDKAAKHGFQMAVHAIGDEGNDRTLKAYEGTLELYPEQDHRWRIEHAQVVLPDYYDRVSSLGVLSSVQSSHAVGDSGWAEDRIGSERIKHAYAWQKIRSAGGRIMLNSDLPGEPWTPMETLYFAVTRKRLDGTPPGGWYPGEALSVQAALISMTLENAYGAFQEQDLGSLKSGKWADFVLLDENPLQTAPDMIKDIKVKSVWVAGNAVE